VSVSRTQQQEEKERSPTLRAKSKDSHRLSRDRTRLGLDQNSKAGGPAEGIKEEIPDEGY